MPSDQLPINTSEQSPSYPDGSPRGLGSLPNLGNSEPPLSVTDDFGTCFPLGEAEIEVIEAYFNDLIDIVLAQKECDTATFLCRKDGP